MTPARFNALLAAQTPDAEKRAKADFVIDTSRDFDQARAQVRAILAALRSGREAGHENA
jgi:dephospho-CoA kinase